MSAVKSVLAKLGVSAAVAAVDQYARHHVSDWWEKKKLEKQVADGETFEGVETTVDPRSPATSPFDAIRRKATKMVGQLRSPKPQPSDAAEEFKAAHLATDDDEPEIEA
jgi:hypothetical protein